MADPYPGTPHSQPQHSDDDPTDELPVLSDIAIIEAESGTAEDADRPASDDTTILFGTPARMLGAPARTTQSDEDTGADTAALESRVTELSERWSHLEDQLDRNTATLGSLSQQLAEAQSALNDSTANERQLNQRLADKDAELDRLRGENLRLERDHEALQQAHAALRSDHESLRSDHEGLRQDHESLDRARATLRQELEAEDARRGELERRQNQQRSEWQTELDAARAAHDTLEAELAAARKQVQELREAQRAASDGDDPSAAYRDEIAALSGYIENRRARWNEMEAEVAAQRQRIVELEREMAQRVDRQQLAEQTAQRETARAAELKAQLSELAGRLDAERRRAPAADAAARRHAELERALEAVRTMLAEHRSDLERMVTDLHGPQPEDAAPILTDTPDADANERIAKLHGELREQLELIREAARRRAQAAEPPAAPEAASAAATQRSLICLTSERPRQYELVKPVMTIGRSAAADIQILTHFVSREHARLLVDEDNVRIEDLGSTNGVFVNSVRVHDHVLNHGDWVTIGESQFRFLSAASD